MEAVRAAPSSRRHAPRRRHPASPRQPPSTNLAAAPTQVAGPRQPANMTSIGAPTQIASPGRPRQGGLVVYNSSSPRQISNLAGVPVTPIASPRQGGLVNTPASPRQATAQTASPRQGGKANQVRSQGGQGAERRGQRGQETPNGSNKIHVSGFPVYTQAQDLTQVFSQFGDVRVDRMTPKYACLVYPTAEEAAAAIQSSPKLIIYGEFLAVRPFASAPPPPEGAKHARKRDFTRSKQKGTHTMHHGTRFILPGDRSFASAPPPPEGAKHAHKRDFTRSKQKGVIVEPKEIDLSGDFPQQLESILSRVRLTQQEAAAIGELYSDVETVLQALWPGCVAMPFGSITTGLGIKTSDADCYMHLPHNLNGAAANHVQRAKRVLHSYPHLFAEILSIPRANTPIVKFFHIPTETNCDLTFKTPLGSQNSKLIAFLLHADPRLIPMAVTIKYWAKVHGFSGTGKLTNYALTMMIIFYLQQPPMSILPSVEWLQRDSKYDVIVDHWNTGFAANELPPSSNTSSISELLGGFFEFYSTFNFDEMVVCPYLGTPIKKETFKDVNLLPDAYQRYKDNVLQGLVYPFRHTTSMCVQDPFEQSHNVASAITTKLASDIKAYLKFAADAYEKEKLNKCNEFLKIILLEKPKLAKSKPHEYRVHLFPRLIVNIKDEDWKSAVRQMIITTIFETMLKVKLSKVDDKPNPGGKKVKEKYTATVEKAIWKRKQFSRLYSAMNLDFKQTQTRITEEIMKVDKEVLNLQFVITVTYAPDPRSVAVVLKLTDGDVEVFNEFGRFIISVLQNWFVVLLKPEAKPPALDSAAQVAETIKLLDGATEPNTSVDSDDVSITSETANTQEGASEKDSAVNDASEKDSAVNDASEKDSAVNDASEKDSAVNDASEKDSAVNDASEKDSAVNDASEKDSAINDASEKDSAINDASEKDSAINDASVKDSAINDASEKDSAINDASEKDSAINDASEKDSAINDASEKDSAINDASEKDSAINDASVKDSAINDASVKAEDSSVQGSQIINEDLP